jgi:hypothetical protein
MTQFNPYDENIEDPTPSQNSAEPDSSTLQINEDPSSRAKALIPVFDYWSMSEGGSFFAYSDSD